MPSESWLLFLCSLLTFVLCGCVQRFSSSYNIHRHPLPLLTFHQLPQTVNSRPICHLRVAKAVLQHPPNHKLPLLPWIPRDPPVNAGNYSKPRATTQLTRTPTMPQHYRRQIFCQYISPGRLHEHESCLWCKWCNLRCWIERNLTRYVTPILQSWAADRGTPCKTGGGASPCSEQSPPSQRWARFWF